MDNAITSAEPATVTLRDGRKVLARPDRDGRLWAVTYANLTQARKKAAELGAGWFVADMRRPFLVVKEN